jgi:hypothetical protein
MSLQLKQDHKFTPAEIAYLADRNRYAEIEENARLEFPDVSEPAPEPEPEPAPQSQPPARVGHKKPS